MAISHGRKVLDKVNQIDGVASKFLDIHVNEDEDHIESAFKVLESCDTTDIVQIEKNMKLSTELYLNFVNAARFQSKRTSEAA